MKICFDSFATSIHKHSIVCGSKMLLKIASAKVAGFIYFLTLLNCASIDPNCVDPDKTAPVPDMGQHYL